MAYGRVKALYPVFASVTPGVTEESSSLRGGVIEESGATDESGVIGES